MSLLTPFRDLRPAAYAVTWRSPSNIALVKYWGKKGPQLPANPSLSMSLRDCFSQTHVSFNAAEKLSVELKLEGQLEPAFATKIEAYLTSLQAELPWLKQLSLKVDTHNTFPHGTGIASSASGLSALALCIVDYLYFLKDEKKGPAFFQQASYLARLGSGSACRSVYGGFTSWGKSELPDSSDEYAIQVPVHTEMENLQDTVLIIDQRPKRVSSTQGHGRMTDHPFAQARFEQGRLNHSAMLSALQAGEMGRMGQLLESEALSLHAMMLTSPVPYTLLLPGTLAAIELVKDFRAQSKLPLYFTLDAGPNLHLIYPESCKHKINTFIANELSSLGQSYIADQRGEGPVLC
jgi:diphosphomevalonate decarboxylase